MNVTTASSCGMFTDAGNARVAALIEETLQLPLATTDRDIYAHLQTRMNQIAQDGHGEVWDTAVREVIIGRIERKTERNLTIYF